MDASTAHTCMHTCINAHTHTHWSLCLTSLWLKLNILSSVLQCPVSLTQKLCWQSDMPLPLLASTVYFSQSLGCAAQQIFNTTSPKKVATTIKRQLIWQKSFMFSLQYSQLILTELFSQIPNAILHICLLITCCRTRQTEWKSIPLLSVEISKMNPQNKTTEIKMPLHSINIWIKILVTTKTNQENVKQYRLLWYTELSWFKGNPKQESMNGN